MPSVHGAARAGLTSCLSRYMYFNMKCLVAGLVVVSLLFPGQSRAQIGEDAVDSNSTVTTSYDSLIASVSAQMSEAQFKCDVLAMNRVALTEGRGKVDMSSTLSAMPIGDLKGEFVTGQVEQHLDSLLGLKVFVWYYTYWIPRHIYLVGWDANDRLHLLRGFGPTELKHLFELIDGTTMQAEATRNLVDFYLRVLWSTDDYMAIDSLSIASNGNNFVATAVTHVSSEPDPIWKYYEHHIVIDENRNMAHSVDTVRTSDSP